MTGTMHMCLESLCHLLSKSPVFFFFPFLLIESGEVLACLYKEKCKLSSFRGAENTVEELQLMMNQSLISWGARAQ